YVLTTIVGNLEAVSIERTIDEQGALLELTVDPEDLGRVIGKRGTGAQALRTLMRAIGTKTDARYDLKIVDVGEGRERQERKERNEERDEEPIEQKQEAEPADAEEPAEEKVEEVQDEDEQEDAVSSFDKTRR